MAPDTPASSDGLRAGGAATVSDASGQAFSRPAPNLTAAELELHLDGDAAFEQKFVTPPAPVGAGLGPLFNANACEACHVRDGRAAGSLLLRLSGPGAGPHGGPVPVVGYGGQLQDRAVYGVEPEGQLAVTYEEVQGSYLDGTSYTLRKPIYRVAEPRAPLSGDVALSPRSPAPVFGMGLLEAVPAEEIRGMARSGPGISGRPNMVWDADARRTALGRFGWKANVATVKQQVETAYLEDMGVTSPATVLEGEEPEVDDGTVAAVTFYVRTLAVPAQRERSEQAEVGARIFRTIGCADCHVPTLHTGTLPGVPAVSNQTIRPFTDLLLHDMGEGLADGRADFVAGPREWRTAPLWGMGLSLVVNGHSELLHDGRARTPEEAILWHGGEAAPARDAYRALSRDQREALLAYLRTL